VEPVEVTAALPAVTVAVAVSRRQHLMWFPVRRFPCASAVAEAEDQTAALTGRMVAQAGVILACFVALRLSLLRREAVVAVALVLAEAGLAVATEGRAEAHLVLLVETGTVPRVAEAVRKSRAAQAVRAIQETMDRLAHH